MLVDTHAHLYWNSFKDDLDAVIKRSIDAGVTTIINVGVDVKLSKIAAKQVKSKLRKIPGLSSYSTIGIHPHEAIKYPNDVSIHRDIVALEKLYQSQPDQIVAVGECGLDYNVHTLQEVNDVIVNDYKDIGEQNKKMQRPLFQAQIDLAKKLNLPLLVHCRDDRSQNPSNTEAWDEVLDLVGTHPTVLHCYSGFMETTKKILSSPTLVVSFAGTITYPKNEYLREAAKVLPLDRIVLETDCPFLPTQSIRGQRNEPSSVLEIATLVAEIKGITEEEVAIQTSANAVKIFAF